MFSNIIHVLLSSYSSVLKFMFGSSMELPLQLDTFFEIFYADRDQCNCGE